MQSSNSQFYLHYFIFIYVIRTLICGDRKAGLSIFWADDGLDTGPILLQEECDVLEDDTVDTLYKRFLYPVGVLAVARAVDMVANGTAPKLVQTEEGATYDPMLNKPELQKVSNFIRTQVIRGDVGSTCFG